MQNDKKIEENKEVGNAVLKEVGKPENFLFCRAMNVFDDRYRVNIYTRSVKNENLETLRISQSYFVRYAEGNLKILNF